MTLKKWLVITQNNGIMDPFSFRVMETPGRFESAGFWQPPRASAWRRVAEVRRFVANASQRVFSCERGGS